MTATLRLTDGTTTVDLLSADIQLEDGGLSISPTPTKTIWGEEARIIRLRIKLQGANHDALIDSINSLNNIVRIADDAYRLGWGTEMHLESKWDTATNTTYIDVVGGEPLRLPDNFMRGLLDASNTIRNAVLTLVCRPYAHGTLSGSHENYCDNPSFEHYAVTGLPPGDSWAEQNNADVTTTLDTTNKKYGSQSLQMVTVLDAVNDTGVGSDNIVCAAPASTGYIEVWGRHVAGDKVSVEIYDQTHAAFCALGADIFWNAADSQWTKIGTTFTKPLDCLAIQVQIHVEAEDSTAAGATIQVDGVYCNPVHGSTPPTFWVSSRNLTNEYDPATADQINYLDVEGVDSEQVAGLRLAGAGGEWAHRWRQTPYLYTHNYEVEAGTLNGAAPAVTDTAVAGYSAGRVARREHTSTGAVFIDYSIITVNTTMVQRYGRVHVFLSHGSNAAGGPGTYYLRLSLRYGSTPTNIMSAESELYTHSSTRRWHDFGVFELPPAALMPRDGEVDEWKWVVEMKVATANAGNYLYLDNLHIVPVEEGYVLGNSTTGPNVLDTTQEPPYRGRLVTIGDDSSDWSQDVTRPVGDHLYAMPNRQNRYIWRKGADITTTAQVRVKVMPRFLLVG